MSPADPRFDMSDLSGDSEPVGLADFLRDNSECPPDPEEVAELLACEIGAVVRLGIGGGGCVVRRVA